MELAHLKDVHLVLFNLAVNELIADMTQNFLFDSWTFCLHKIYLKLN